MSLEGVLSKRGVTFEIRGRNLVVFLDRMEEPPSLKEFRRAVSDAGLTSFKPSKESKTFALALKGPRRKGVEEQLLATFKERKALIFHDYEENCMPAASVHSFILFKPSSSKTSSELKMKSSSQNAA